VRVRVVAGRRRRQRNVIMRHPEDVRRRSSRREEVWRVRHSILPSTLHLTVPLPTHAVHRQSPPKNIISVHHRATPRQTDPPRTLSNS
jgi:hypothetical protein